MTLREFAEYRHYYRRYPWDEDWERAAWLAAVHINSNPFRRGLPITPAELLAPADENPREIEGRNQAIWANLAIHQQQQDQ